MSGEMTLKEFQEVLTNVGIDFNVYKYEGILNLIQLGERHIADIAKSNGSISVYNCYKECANKIYNVLEVKGYYN